MHTNVKANRKRTFVHAEIGFFELWWRDQTETVKKTVRGLVQAGQLEFVSGGWISSDEACPVFTELIENMKVGHDFLYREFGLPPPKIAWHMDAFGHSATTARMFTEVGFDAFFFSRMNQT